jgi:hypothetical protein
MTIPESARWALGRGGSGAVGGTRAFRRSLCSFDVAERVILKRGEIAGGIGEADSAMDAEPELGKTRQWAVGGAGNIFNND